jgi:hypothetical protein
MSVAEDVLGLRAEYRGLVIEWDEAKDNPAEANGVFDRLHHCYERLRESAAGRQAIGGLIDDPITAVRLSAAAHSPAWQPVAAQAALQEIESQPTGLYAVDAKWTVRWYRQGKLNLDW